MPGVILSALHAATHLILTTNPTSRYCYFLHFTNEEMKVRGVTCPRKAVDPALQSHVLSPHAALWLGLRCLGLSPCPTAHVPWPLGSCWTSSVVSISWRCYLTHLFQGLLGDTHEAVGVSSVSWNELREEGGRELRPMARKARPARDKDEEESSGLSQWKVLMWKSLWGNVLLTLKNSSVVTMWMRIN